MEWLTRMKDALDLMEARMEERLDIAEIAKAACSSPYHFQRMFHMLTGMTVGEYTRKRKLTLAAQELAISGDRVLDIALKYGYDSPEAFAKAFRKVHGISPSDARGPGASLKAFPRISFHLSLKGDKDMDYRIVEQNAFEVNGLFIKMPCEESSREIPKLWQQCNADGTVERLAAASPDGLVIGVIEPMESKQDEMAYWIAARTGSNTQADGLKRMTIPALTWAVFPSVGAMPTAIQSIWCRIYQEWFPGTGYEHAVGPELEVYPPGDTTADDYRCEVWIPIVK